MDFLEVNEQGPEQQEAREVALSLEDRREKAREALETARAYQKSYYDKTHKPMSFRVGQRVWLDLRNVRTTRPSKKLDLRRIGSCRILEKVGSQAYRLELPAGLNIHNVFHVSLIREHHSREGVDSSAHHTVRQAPEEAREYMIDKIIDSKKEGRRLFYRVHWMGYNEDKDKTWEPVANIRHLRKKLYEYHKANPGRLGIREFTKG
jgi:hypothetical protein